MIERIVIINDFARAQGGATIIALESASEFRRQGLEVTFLSGDGESHELADLGVEHHALGSSALLELPQAKALAQGIYNREAKDFLDRWINENDTPRTVYHLHNWSQILSPSVFSALRRVEERLVVTCHDFFNICPNGGFTHFRHSEPCELRPLSTRCVFSQCDRRSPVQKYWRTIRHLQLNIVARFGESRATFTFLNSQMESRFVEAGFAAKDRASIPNPVTPWTRERIKAERNRGFLFVGRTGRDKGADIAIRAASAAGQRLILIGEGELESTTKLDGQSAEFAGWLDREQIADIARQSRALLVPSRIVEPFGLVLLEAAMSGMPVIFSSHAFLAKGLVEIGAGLPFDAKNTDDLAALITRISGDDDLVERLSRNGFNRANQLCNDSQSWTKEIVSIMERKLLQSERAN